MVKKFLGLDHQNLFRSMRSKLPEHQRFDINTIGLIYVLSGSDELNTLLAPVLHPEHGLDAERALLICQKAENDDIRKLGLITVCIYANRNVSVQDLSDIENDLYFDLLIESIQIKRRGIETVDYTPSDTGTIHFNEY